MTTEIDGSASAPAVPPEPRLPVEPLLVGTATPQVRGSVVRRRRRRPDDATHGSPRPSPSVTTTGDPGGSGDSDPAGRFSAALRIGNVLPEGNGLNAQRPTGRRTANGACVAEANEFPLAGSGRYVECRPCATPWSRAAERPAECTTAPSWPGIPPSAGP